MTKRILAILLALLMVLALVPVTSADEPVTLRVLWWGSQTRHDLTMAAIDSTTGTARSKTDVS